MTDRGATTMVLIALVADTGQNLILTPKTLSRAMTT
jgi:hypothetical protein